MTAGRQTWEVSSNADVSATGATHPEGVNTQASGSGQATTQIGSGIWLVVVPTLCALIPWLLVAIALGEGVSPSLLLVAGCTPMIGVVSAAAYGLRTSSLRTLWPLLPFGAAAGIWLGSTLVGESTYGEAAVLEGASWHEVMWFGHDSLLGTSAVPGSRRWCDCLRAPDE